MPHCSRSSIDAAYWLLISMAAYRALWQFATARFEWEKTEHGRACRATARSG
jgi:hypothetical protein